MQKCPVVLFVVSSVAASVAAAQTPAKPAFDMSKPVEQMSKNIKVLNGMPAGQLGPTMSFIATSLGVRCDYCHDPKDYASDAKGEKKTAREMITMTLGINKQSFEGKPEVSCYTCHRGDISPRGVPSLDPADWAKREPTWSRVEGPTPPTPKADDVLAKFVEASGGRAALQKHKTQLTTGTATFSEGGPGTFEALKKAGGKYVLTTTTTEGEKTQHGYQAFDGAQFWVGHNDRRQSTWMPETAQIRVAGELATPVELLSYKDPKVRGLEKNGDRQAWVVGAIAPDGKRERLWFDTKTGLLVHRTVEVSTYLGRLLFGADYDDYKDVDGAKVPFTVKLSQARRSVTYTVKDVKNDVDAPDDKFKMPEPPKAPEAPKP